MLSALGEQLKFGSNGGATPTDIGFTGQRLDATGLMFYNARYYSTTLGRFISADTIVPEPGKPQSLNRFAYSYNNPLKYIDPSGHEPLEDEPEPPITIDERGFCIHFGNIGCSETLDHNWKWIQWNLSMIDDEIMRRITPEYWNAISAELADGAFNASTIGGLIEAGLTAFGFGLGQSFVVGGSAGAGAGMVLGNSIHQNLTNKAETLLSSASTFTAVMADMMAQNNTFEFENGSLTVTVGESSATSLLTQGVGNMIPIGVVDAVIDGYASSYSHGEAPGVYNLPRYWGYPSLYGQSIHMGPLSLRFGR